MSFREERLKERIAEVRPGLQKAREIAELAESEGRDMTPDEQKTYDEGVSRARSVADAVKQHRHDQEVFAFAKDLSDNVIGGLSDGELSSPGAGSKSRRLSFKGMGAGIAAQMLPDGMKSLAPSGAAVVGHARSLAAGPGIPPCFPGPLLVEDLSSVGWRSARSPAIESAAVGVERRPVNRLIALATRPRRVATAVTEAGLMPDQHFTVGRRCVRWGRRSVGG